MIAIKIGLGDALYWLDPKPDITPLESARLTEFLVVLTAHTNSMSGYPTVQDRTDFVEKHSLKRHFTKEEKQDGN